MLCEKCNEREAVVTLTMVTNGVSKTHHFCHECANQFRLDEVNENSELSKTIFRLLSEAIGGHKPGNEEGKPEEQPDLFCRVCGKTYQEFKEDGLFGCPDCIKAFGEELQGTIRSLQGADTYNGSRPEKIRRKRKPAAGASETAEKSRKDVLIDLQNQLDSAVLMEEYEKAAELRDRIRSMTETRREEQ